MKKLLLMLSIIHLPMLAMEDSNNQSSTQVQQNLVQYRDEMKQIESDLALLAKQPNSNTEQLPLIVNRLAQTTQNVHHILKSLTPAMINNQVTSLLLEIQSHTSIINAQSILGMQATATTPKN